MQPEAILAVGPVDQLLDAVANVLGELGEEDFAGERAQRGRGVSTRRRRDCAGARRTALPPSEGGPWLAVGHAVDGHGVARVLLLEYYGSTASGGVL